MFLPLVGMVLVLTLDLAKEAFSEATLNLLTSLTYVLGGCLFVFFSLFLLLMNAEVSFGRLVAFLRVGGRSPGGTHLFLTPSLMGTVPSHVFQHGVCHSNDTAGILRGRRRRPIQVHNIRSDEGVLVAIREQGGGVGA